MRAPRGTGARAILSTARATWSVGHVTTSASEPSRWSTMTAPRSASTCARVPISWIWRPARNSLTRYTVSPDANRPLSLISLEDVEGTTSVSAPNDFLTRLTEKRAPERRPHVGLDRNSGARPGRPGECRGKSPGTGRARQARHLRFPIPRCSGLVQRVPAAAELFHNVPLVTSGALQPRAQYRRPPAAAFARGRQTVAEFGVYASAVRATSRR